jgi:hypothetical protein
MTKDNIREATGTALQKVMQQVIDQDEPDTEAAVLVQCFRDGNMIIVPLLNIPEDSYEDAGEVIADMLEQAVDMLRSGPSDVEYEY